MYAILILAAVCQAGPKNVGPQRAGLAERKEARDRAVKELGPPAGACMMAYGDVAIFAFQACTKEGGQAIVRLWESGDLARLKSPRAALNVVRVHGDQAATFIEEHLDELLDPFSLQAFVAEPGEYINSFKLISDGAAAIRESRRVVPAWATSAAGETNALHLVGIVLLGVLIGLTVWKRRIPVVP